MTYYKVLDAENRSCHGGEMQWVPGEWQEVKGEIKPCANGIHMCRATDLVEWLGPTIWRAEVEGEVVERNNKVVVRKARITERLEAWTEKSARLFACECARRVLPLYEAKYPQNKRPRIAIEVSERYANDRATDIELETARADAWVAARNAKRDAAWVVAWDAARAAWDAAGDVAWAARDARDAVRAAARDARDAAWAAAGAVERTWQTERLMEILGIKGDE